MKYTISIILFLFINLVNAQDARPFVKGKINTFTHHKRYDIARHTGEYIKLVKIDENVYFVLRERVYGEDAIQSTLIFRHRQTELKAYSYLNFPDCSLTYAITLRIYLSRTQRL